MKIPEDKNLNISQFYFYDGSIDIGRWTDLESKMIQTVFRKKGGSWRFGKPGGTADSLLRIHYLDKKSTVDQAWDSLEAFME